MNNKSRPQTKRRVNSYKLAKGSRPAIMLRWMSPEVKAKRDRAIVPTESWSEYLKGLQRDIRLTMRARNKKP
jgi:hypothetical protein